MSDRPRSCFGVFPSDFGLARLSSGAALFSSAIPFLLLLLKSSISECPSRRVVSVSRSFLQSETHIFKSASQMGSYKSGDSTFYPLIENYANSGDFGTLFQADGVSVWEWSGSALDEGDEASQRFSTYLGKPSRLVRFNAASETRAVDPKFAPGFKIMFSDEYPFLLISQGSLDALNELLKESVPINRFRPNILVDGCEPFSEDLWKDLRINGFKFQGVKLCSRCKVPTINQENGIAGSEPSETLKEFRSDKVLRPNKKQQGKVYFGQNLVCKDSLTQGKGKAISVGDCVYVLSKASSPAEAAA